MAATSAVWWLNKKHLIISGSTKNSCLDSFHIRKTKIRKLYYRLNPFPSEPLFYRYLLLEHLSLRDAFFLIRTDSYKSMRIFYKILSRKTSWTKNCSFEIFCRVFCAIFIFSAVFIARSVVLSRVEPESRVIEESCLSRAKVVLKSHLGCAY